MVNSNNVMKKTSFLIFNVEKPIQLAAHERPITKIRINRDGDLLFSTGKDGQAMAWYMSDGMRLGTYEGHNGAINDVAVDFDS